MKKKGTREVMYYLLLVLLIMFTTGLAHLLLPLVMVGSSFVVYVIALTMGIVFGLFIVFFVMDLDDLTHHHHAGIWAIVLFGAVLNFTIAALNMPVITSLNLNSTTNSFITGGLFALGFFIPYIIYLINEHKLDKHAQKSD